jgi:hypothetical protein
VVANACKQALIRFLGSQRARAAVLETVNVGCAPEEAPCIRRIWGISLPAKALSAVQLTYRKRKPINIVGDISVPFRRSTRQPTIRSPGSVSIRLAGYIIQVRAVLSDGEMVGTLRGDMDGVN